MKRGVNTQHTRSALITGASSGIGAAFARKLASQKTNLLLVARREARLANLAADLERQFGVNAEVLAADLSTPGGVERVETRIADLDTLDLLINNAGFGFPSHFVDAPLEKSLAMIQVHVLASVRLNRAVLPGMIARGHGGIVNVSSIGAFLPRPGDAAYCATKAYLNAFSQALQAELRSSGVQVQALCPGFVATEFLDHPEYEAMQVKARIPRWLWTPVEDVVEESLRALNRDQVVCIPGGKNRAIVALARSGLAGVLLKRLTNNLRGPSPNSARRLATATVGQRTIRVKKP
jgi:uncharacterized protein